MVYSILALHYLGYPLDHPAMVKGLKAIEDFCLEDEQGRRMQSCLSPIWDTALNALALLEARIAPRPSRAQAAQHRGWCSSRSLPAGTGRSRIAVLREDGPSNSSIPSIRTWMILRWS